MALGRGSVLLALLVTACGAEQSALGGDDQDGVVGGDVTFLVAVDDSEFSPTAIWKTQNLTNVTFVLRNDGTKPHGYRVRCAGSDCFPPESAIAPLDPGATSTAKWKVPYPEGLHDVDDDTGLRGGPTGQFIVQ